jgi:hypothetical protein
MFDSNEIYRHFKGGYYQVFGTAIDNSNATEYVFYQQMYEPYSLWLRPKDMFFGTRLVDGMARTRFEKIGVSHERVLQDETLSNLDVTHSETGEHFRVLIFDNEKEVFFIQRIVL